MASTAGACRFASLEKILVGSLCLMVLLLTQAVNAKKILIFGGNGFIGADTAKEFIDRGEDVTLVNRGNWYWDSAQRIRPHVKNIICNRRNAISDCTELVDFVSKTDSFDVVVDFSAYHPKQTREASRLLKDKAKLYILLSSDSIYEVCEKDHVEPTRETDDVRGTHEETMQSGRLATWDWDLYDHTVFHQDAKYGDNKQLAEEELRRQRAKGGIPYIFLRIPDVIGPRDTTLRWWMYQILVKLENHPDGQPLMIPAFLKDYRLSMVYSPDVARLVADLSDEGTKVHDQAFNVAFPRTIYLTEVIAAIRKNLGVENTEIKTTNDPKESFLTYPSILKGPIDVTKVHEMTNWKATPFEEAVRETVVYFERAMRSSEFSSQKNVALSDFTQLHLAWADTKKLYAAIEQAYGVKLEPRVEL